MFNPNLNDGDDVLLGWLKRAALTHFSRTIREVQMQVLVEVGADPVTAAACVELVKRLRQQARGISPRFNLTSEGHDRG